MASSLPPVKGAAFTHYMGLVSQADTDIFKTSVTFAAGDVTVSKDGGAFTNITTLPVEIGTSGVLAVGLSATEMTADVVAVRLHDAAGDEWQDALLTIYTAAQTLDTTDGVADDVKATVNHTDYGNAKLVRSTTPANTLDVAATGNAGIDWANISGKTTTVALTGTTISATGSGSVSWVYTLTSSVDATPIADATIEAYTDLGMSTLVDADTTDAFGQVTLDLDPGTYYIKRIKSGWTFTNPDTEVVV